MSDSESQTSQKSATPKESTPTVLASIFPPEIPAGLFPDQPTRRYRRRRRYRPRGYRNRRPQYFRYPDESVLKQQHIELWQRELALQEKEQALRMQEAQLKRLHSLPTYEYPEPAMSEFGYDESVYDNLQEDAYGEPHEYASREVSPKSVREFGIQAVVDSRGGYYPDEHSYDEYNRHNPMPSRQNSYRRYANYDSKSQSSSPAFSSYSTKI